MVKCALHACKIMTFWFKIVHARFFKYVCRDEPSHGAFAFGLFFGHTNENAMLIANLVSNSGVYLQRIRVAMFLSCITFYNYMIGKFCTITAVRCGETGINLCSRSGFC